MEKDLGAMMDGGRSEWLRTHDLEKVLAYLRQQGASKNDCITVLKRLGIVEKTDAKRAVHFSTTWEDHRESDATIHDHLATKGEKNGQ